MTPVAAVVAPSQPRRPRAEAGEPGGAALWRCGCARGTGGSPSRGAHVRGQLLIPWEKAVNRTPEHGTSRVSLEQVEAIRIADVSLLTRQLAALPSNRPRQAMAPIRAPSGDIECYGIEYLR